MKKELKKKEKTMCNNVLFYVTGGTNEGTCSNNNNCGTSDGSNSGGSSRPMGGTTVCFN